MIDVEPAALLADASVAAAYYVDIRDRAAMVEAAGALDFEVLAANLEAVDDGPALHRAIAAAIALPGAFDGSQEHLAAGLGDLSWLPAPGYLLLLDHCASVREAAPGDFSAVLAMLDQAARGHAAAGVPFWTLLPVASTD